MKRHVCLRPTIVEDQSESVLQSNITGGLETSSRLRLQMKDFQTRKEIKHFLFHNPQIQRHKCKCGCESLNYSHAKDIITLIGNNFTKKQARLSREKLRSVPWQNNNNNNNTTTIIRAHTEISSYYYFMWERRQDAEAKALVFESILDEGEHQRVLCRTLGFAENHLCQKVSIKGEIF